MEILAFLIIFIIAPGIIIYFNIKKHKQHKHLDIEVPKAPEAPAPSVQTTQTPATRRRKIYNPKQKKYMINLTKTPTIAENLKIIFNCFKENPFERGKKLWSDSYKKPVDEMLKELKTSGKLCGIYKITNTKNNKIYIGQSKDIEKRWRTHIRSGIGAEYQSQNQLYLDMMEFGPETFTFEILEQCNEDHLDEYEKYWITYFDSYNKGYNQTQGNN